MAAVRGRTAEGASPSRWLAGQVARCPQCRSDQLSVSEVTEVVGTTDFGVVHLDERGDLVPPGPFGFEPGGILSVSLMCGVCRHHWRTRKRVAW